MIVMASLAAIASNYTFLLFGWHAAANSNFALIVGAVIWIALMTVDLLPRDRAVGRIQTLLLGSRSSRWRCSRSSR